MLAVPILQLALLYMDHPDVRSQLFYRTVSTLSGGFYNVGVTAGKPGEFLQTYSDRMGEFPVHPQRHPPGLSLLFLWARDLLARQPTLADEIADELRPFQCHNLDLMALDNPAIASATLQMMVPVLLALLIPPLYLLTWRHYGEDAASNAILIFPLIPSIALWATRWNHLYGLFTLFCLLFVHAGLTKKRLYFLFLAGFTISLASFFSFGNFALIGFAGSYGLVWLWFNRDQLDWRWFLVGIASAAIGVASVWAFLFLLHVNLFALMQQSLSLHYGLQRNYWLWLGYHVYDFFVFLGIPIVVLWLFRLFQEAVGRRHKSGDILLISFALGLFVLDVSGMSQGEVARVWAFLMPLALATAVRPLAQRKWLFIIIMLLMAIQVFISNIYLRPVGTGLSDPPPSPTQVALNGNREPVRWQEGPILLDATIVRGTNKPGNVLRVKTVWTTDTQIDKPYTIFVHGVDDVGRLVAQADGQPLDGRWPTTCWQPDAQFADEFELQVPDGISSNDLRIRLGFYWLPTGERVLIEPDGQDALELLRS
jgi:hypothetical protein